MLDSALSCTVENLFSEILTSNARYVDVLALEVCSVVKSWVVEKLDEVLNIEISSFIDLLFLSYIWKYFLP